MNILTALRRIAPFGLITLCVGCVQTRVPTSTPTAAPPTFTASPLPTIIPTLTAQPTETPRPTMTERSSLATAVPPSATPPADDTATPEPLPPPDGGCSISTDPTYGYTPGNPIKVAGDWLDGPERERIYLDNLRGPAGEPLSYARQGSDYFGDVILDTYVLSGLPQPIELYLDMYNYAPPLAPVGLTCVGPFALTAP